MSRYIFTSKFQNVKVIVPESEFNRHKKDELLFNIVDVREKLIIAL